MDLVLGVTTPRYQYFSHEHPLLAHHISLTTTGRQPIPRMDTYKQHQPQHRLIDVELLHYKSVAQYKCLHLRRNYLKFPQIHVGYLRVALCLRSQNQ